MHDRNMPLSQHKILTPAHDRPSQPHRDYLCAIRAYSFEHLKSAKSSENGRNNAISENSRVGCRGREKPPKMRIDLLAILKKNLDRTIFH